MISNTRLLSLVLWLPLSIIATAASIATDTIPEEELEELVVTGNSARQRLERVALGAENLELSQLELLPSFFGENDVIKSITLLPGVRSEGEGGGGFEVRGGNSSQNLVLLDGMTLYNPAHVMGIFSTFNDASTGHATLFKGTVPAEFGGASSAVLDVSLLPGNMEKWEGEASLGLLIAKCFVSGPVVKDKLSIAVGGRRSYADLFIQMIPQYKGTVMNFYDATTRIRYVPSESHIIDGSFIISHDNMAIKDVMGMYWGNLAASLGWFARCSDRFSLNTTASYTDYAPKMVQTFTGDDREMRQYIRDLSLQICGDWRISDYHTLRCGLDGELLKVKSMDMASPGGRQVSIKSGAAEAIWAQYAGSFGQRFDMEVGFRMNFYSTLASDRFHKYQSFTDYASPDFSNKNYFLPEPRVSLKYEITDCHNLKAGFAMTSQYIHSLRSSSTSFPFDRYTLSSAEINPERCRQYGIGYSGMTENGDFDWSAEAYWKSLSGIYDYRDGMTMFSQVNISSIILGGKGRSYGLELMLRKNSGPLTGWIGYTLSHTQSRIPGINNDKWYNANNDRRHDLSVAAIYKFGTKWSLSGQWIFSSGQPLTAPDSKYELSGVTVYYYSARNVYRTPPTHRLDISATYTKKHRKFTSEWNFGIYNVYCRYNPYIIYFEDDPDSPSGSKAVLRALFGLLPSVSYTISF